MYTLLRSLSDQELLSQLLLIHQLRHVLAQLVTFSSHMLIEFFEVFGLHLCLHQAHILGTLICYQLAFLLSKLRDRALKL